MLLNQLLGFNIQKHFKLKAVQQNAFMAFLEGVFFMLLALLPSLLALLPILLALLPILLVLLPILLLLLPILLLHFTWLLVKDNDKLLHPYIVLLISFLMLLSVLIY